MIDWTAGFKTAGFKTAGFKTAGLKTAGLKTAGLKTAGLKTAGQKNLYWQGLRWSGLWFFVSIMISVQAEPVDQAIEQPVDQMLQALNHSLLSDLTQAPALLLRLEAIQTEFDKPQQHAFALLRATYLHLSGKHRERIALLRRMLDEVVDGNTRVKFLSQLSAAYWHQGEYEAALRTMEQGMRLLSGLTTVDAKSLMLQEALGLLIALGGLEEARTYANRLHRLGIESHRGDIVCSGLGKQIELQFHLGENEAARVLMANTLSICDDNHLSIVSDRLRSLDAVSLIDSDQAASGIEKALELLPDMQAREHDPELILLLEAALARGYHRLNEWQQAESFGLRAYRRAVGLQSRQMVQNISKTLAQIKRAQGALAAALDYYDVFLAAKLHVDQQQSAKKLAYQRVKYDNQDKGNQLELLKFKKNSLSLTQQLQERDNQNLILLVLLAVVLLIFMTILLVFSLKQKRALIYAGSSADPGDSLSGFIARTGELIEQSGDKGEGLGLLLFELDNFAQLQKQSEDFIGYSLVNEVAEACKQQIRQGDQFSRIGDNRFVICLLESKEQGAVSLAGRCKVAIGAIEADNTGLILPLSATFGIAMINEGLSDINEALKAAEKALQLARAAGHNQVYVYHGNEPRAKGSGH